MIKRQLEQYHRISIPIEWRRQYGLEPGMPVEWWVDEEAGTCSPQPLERVPDRCDVTGARTEFPLYLHGMTLSPLGAHRLLQEVKRTFSS